MPTATVSTRQVAEAGGVTARTVARWVKVGLLPAPKVFYGGTRGKQSFWPPEALERATWVRAQIDSGQTFEEILATLATRDGKSSPS